MRRLVVQDLPRQTEHVQLGRFLLWRVFQATDGNMGGGAMTRGVSRQVTDEIAVDICQTDIQENWATQIFGRMCLESPELAGSLATMGRQAMTGGVLVYEAMQRQIRKDALAEMEAKR